MSPGECLWQQTLISASYCLLLEFLTKDSEIQSPLLHWEGQRKAQSLPLKSLPRTSPRKGWSVHTDLFGWGPDLRLVGSQFHPQWFSHLFKTNHVLRRRNGRVRMSWTSCHYCVHHHKHLPHWLSSSHSAVMQSSDEEGQCAATGPCSMLESPHFPSYVLTHPSTLLCVTMGSWPQSWVALSRCAVASVCEPILNGGRCHLQVVLSQCMSSGIPVYLFESII